MGAALDDLDDDVIASINVTPFVDIILVLLIIFMMTSTALSRGSFEVDLPQPAAAGETVHSTVNVVLAADGRMAVNGVPSDGEQLADVIRAEVAFDEELRVVIAADQQADYGQVVMVIDTVEKPGAKSFALDIDQS